MPRTAYVSNPYSAYGNKAEPVRVAKSKARCAGDNGVQFTAPGWRPMVFRSMEAAVAKMERHPGFEGWAS